jgi:hypothetical protein
MSALDQQTIITLLGLNIVMVVINLMVTFLGLIENTRALRIFALAFNTGWASVALLATARIAS